MNGVLGIDLGTGSIKALIVDRTGRVLGRGDAEYPLDHPRPGWAEQEPELWWRGVVAAVRQAAGEAGYPGIAAIGLSGQMHGTVLLDERRRPIRPAIIWADTRGGDQVAAITERIGRAHLIEITGSPVATGFQAASVAWVCEHEPAMWTRVRTVLLPKDYIRWRLTGELATDTSDASSTLLFDVRRREWSAELLGTVGLTPDQLPVVGDSQRITGHLTPEAAGELGLAPGIPVAGGAADAPAGALGAGVVSPDRMLLTISTGAQVMAPSADAMIDREGRIHTWRSAVDGGASGAPWYQMGATMAAGLAMRWLRDEVFALDPSNAYDRMTTWAAPTPPGAAGLVFLPYLAGERTPHMNPLARGVWLGLTADHQRGHLVRSVMEGATFALYDAYDVVRELGARPVEIVLAGGGSRSELWRQIVADVFGLAVRPLLTVEQSALGAALLAGGCAGWFDPAVAARDWATYGAPVEPIASRSAVYRELLAIFRETYSSERQRFERLHEIAARTS